MQIVLAVDENWGIGKDNDMLFFIDKDLAHFKELTMGTSVVMGRKTYESIGHALPDRENIVLTRNETYKLDDALVMKRVEDVLYYAKDFLDEVSIIGGAKIVDEFLEYAHYAHITKIHESKEADTYLHNFDADPDWEIIDQSEVYEENGIKFHFVTYEKKRG